MNRPLGHPAPWPAPGKLNLFLHVVGRRPDGYHLLQTAFQFIDLCDSIRFYARPAGVIERLGEVPGVAPDDDLVVRAARCLAAEAAALGRAPAAGRGDRGRKAPANGRRRRRRQFGCRDRAGRPEPAVGHSA